ncbi:MAG: hypothetical protein WCA49_09770 [Candidatus Sulfotelmatobacter sp.]
MLNEVEEQNRRFVAWLLLAFSCVSASAVQAQFATVKGTVQTSRRTLVDGKVLVKLAGAKKAAHEVNVRGGEYTIHDLLEGKYNLTACAGLNYKANVQPVSVPTSHDVNFILADPDSFHCVPVPDSQGNYWLLGAGRIVSLRDRKTGCEASAATYANGVIRIPRRRLEEYVVTSVSGTPSESNEKCPALGKP